MTSIFFVRHAQPDQTWEDDRTKPLTPLGLSDRQAVTDVLSKFPIDAFVSSPYKRSYDTIAPCAEFFQMEIHTDERLRERKVGENSWDQRRRRWEDFDFCEEGGETLGSLQPRNIEAVNEILRSYKDKNVVVGTHGTALSAILNYYDPSFGFEENMDLVFCMPYIIRLDFEGDEFLGKEELLRLERGY